MFDQKCDQSLETVLIDSPLGGMSITCCDNGLHGLTRIDHSFEPNSRIKVQIKDQHFVSNKWINASIDWLTKYFETPDQLIDSTVTPFCPNVTQSEFYRKVWSTLMNETKFGQTISYSELALRSVGNQRASRAVGTAMKNNPFLLMMPCHRVIKSDGKIGHFSAGASLKPWLLSFEKNLFK